ncbi:DUF3168 domain-containing protein [Mesorhizobium sp. B2-2-4]|uniref:DUF3168 domain-containing protein n=1 Tax=unclassified Mesorhizobium TaxID=325217 RepID=UPI00112BFC3A|nr:MULTISPECIES: DUF3168 domain-containing protein [unclassified Mesorhizobium]TPM59153.1 DUF3168 domain-containing protein [Mesorhizobium sp. B2-2-4]TPM67638.1 DUF3168 domain-containing protein [Mesorhizobium sp. B2-2-1]TPN66920.1 DUF3168 domain-containing protein [Mesorhizobium sp. B1-1-3]
MIGDQLQRAIYAALTAPVLPIVGAKVFDTVPADTPSPYIKIGPAQIFDDGTACVDGWEVFTDIDIWSEPDTGSKLEVMAIGAAVVPRLLGVTGVDGFTVVLAAIESVRYLDDPDGVSKHGIISVRHVLEPA